MMMDKYQYSCRKFYSLKYVFLRMFRLNFIFGNTIENNILIRTLIIWEKSDVDWISGAANIPFFKKRVLK